MRHSKSNRRSRELLLILGGILAINIASIFMPAPTRTALAAPGPVTGNVFNDVNANGIRDAGEGAFSSLAILNLYSSNGSYVKSRTSDSSGNFTFSGLSAGTYYVSVYNTGRTALLNTAPGLVNTIGSHVEQTYASVGVGGGIGSGPICVGAAPTYTQQPNYTVTPGEWTAGAQNGTNSGSCFGGRNATMTNPALTTLVPPLYVANTDYTNLNTALSTQKVVSRIVLPADSGISNVDFGLSENVVTNTSTSGQGSLAQFIANANLNAGAHTMKFVPAVASNQSSGGNSWWRINQGSTALDTITDASTIIDGRAYSNTNGTTQLNTNSGVLPGPTVGTTNYKIDDFQKPELEIVGDARAGGNTALLRTNASNVTIANLGLNSTTNYTTSQSTYIQQSGGIDITIENNLMGVNVATGANFGTRALFGIQTAYLLSLNATGSYRHNFISSNDNRGMLLAGGLLGGGNVVALLLGDWIIEQNDGPSAGVAFGGGTTRIQVRHNNMPTAALDAAPLNASLGLHVLTENTISGGGGVQLQSGLQNTITKNVISNATGSNPGVLVENLSTGNFISQNNFGGNGGNAIDLNGDGVSTNDLLNCVTLSPEIIGLANLGIARPAISNARLSGNQLTMDIGYCGIGIYDVEIYKATSGSGDSNAGEGVTYLGRFLDLALINGTITNQTLTVSGLNPGDSISAIVVNAVTGDTSEFSPNTLASSPPAAPTSAPDMTPETDSGDSNIDNLTNDSTPTFTGACTTGQEVTLYLDAQALVPTQVCSSGSYSITPSSPIVDGAYLLRATFKNGFGESAPGPALAITIDTQAPTTPVATDMTPGTDSGASNTDNITTNTQPIFTGSCTITESTALYIDGSLVASALCVDGTYTLSPSTPLSSGAHTAAVIAFDHAGNTSGASPGLSFSVDTAAPNAPVIATPESGAQANDTTPTIGGQGENGAVITVRDEGGNVLCTATVANDVWTCTPSTALSEGSHNLVATQVDAAGNISPNSTAVTVIIDTTAPNPPVITAPLNGSKTNDTTPTITGTATANSTILLRVNNGAPVTVTTNSEGQWTYTIPSALAEGTYSLIATERDAAGNVSGDSTNVQVTIDTTAPTLTVNQKAGQADPSIDNQLAYTIVFSEEIDGSSFSNSDFTVGSSPASELTDVTQLIQINATTWEAIVTGMPNNTTVSLSLDANKVQDNAGNLNQASTSTDNSIRYEVGPPSVDPLLTNDDTPTLTGDCIANHQLQIELNGNPSLRYTTQCTNGTWSLTLPSLADGIYDVIITDLTVGDLTNAPENQADALVIDTVRPTATLDKKNGQADPTSTNEAFFTLSFSEAINADSLTLSDLDINGTDGDAALTQVNETTWEVHITDMQNGDTVTVSLPADRVEDNAGNLNQASTSTDNSVTYDGSAPAAPAITAPANNLVTNDATITVEGTGENGATVEVLIDGAAASCANAPVVVASGTWVCDLSSALIDGMHTIAARQTDPAGNTSDNSASRSITIDTIAPGQPNAPILTDASDTGQNDDDGITQDTTPTFTGNCIAGETIRLFNGNTQIAEQTCGDGSYTITAPTLPEGTHTLTVIVIDEAGNASPPSEPATVIIDTSAPAAPEITTPEDGGVTNDNTPTVGGTGEDDSTIDVTIGGETITCAEGVARVVDGVWSCTTQEPLPDGNHDVQAGQTDPAGNTSPPSEEVSVTVDTVAPAAPSAPDLVNASDSGVSNTDNVTNDTTPTFSGSCQNDQVIKLYVDSVLAGQATCVGSTYSIDVNPALGDGIKAVTVTETDQAGNESPQSQSLSLTIDTTAPATSTAPDLTTSSDSGASDTDNITQQTTPMFSGSCTSGESVIVYDDSTIMAQALCISGSFTATASTPLTEGNHQITVTTTDSAGNVSAISPALTITIDTTAPVAPAITTPPNDIATNNPHPLIAGTGISGHIVRVFDGSNQVTCVEGNPLVIANGSWTCTPLTAFTTSAHTVTSRQTDPAGNTSAISNSVVITIDTTPPPRPARPDLIATSDSGASNTDNVTNITTPTIAGTCTSGDTIVLRLAGTPLTQQVCANGAYQMTVPSALTSGSKAFTVTATDPAGNTSSPSLTLTVVIDTVAEKPAIPDLDIDSDSGVSQIDNITNVSFPTITGTCQLNETVRVFFDNVLHKTTPCFPPFLAQPLDNLTQGNHSVTIEVIDIAGNLSTRSDALIITIDNMSPGNPTITTPAANTIPVVTTASYITSGTTEANVFLTVYENGNPVCSTMSNGSGAWSCTLTNLTNGQHTYRYVASDHAGNPSSDVANRTIIVNRP